jgi:hypothetical protein
MQLRTLGSHQANLRFCALCASGEGLVWFSVKMFICICFAYELVSFDRSSRGCGLRDLDRAGEWVDCLFFFRDLTCVVVIRLRLILVRLCSFVRLPVVGGFTHVWSLRFIDPNWRSLSSIINS